MNVAPPLPMWEQYGDEDGETAWIVVPEHSPETRATAIEQYLRDIDQADPFEGSCAPVWLHDHELEDCGRKRLEALPADQRDLWEENDEYTCWCDPSGTCVSECMLDDEGSTPAWRISL